MKTRPFRWYRDQRLPMDRPFEESTFATACREVVGPAMLESSDDDLLAYLEWSIQADELEPPSWSNHVDYVREHVRYWSGGFKWLMGSAP